LQVYPIDARPIHVFTIWALLLFGAPVIMQESNSYKYGPNQSDSCTVFARGSFGSAYWTKHKARTSKQRSGVYGGSEPIPEQRLRNGLMGYQTSRTQHNILVDLFESYDYFLSLPRFFCFSLCVTLLQMLDRASPLAKTSDLTCVQMQRSDATKSKSPPRLIPS
jgi:hypothetical protein